VQTPKADDPATRLPPSTCWPPFDDPEGTRTLARPKRCISWRIEWLDLDLLAALEADASPFVPRL